MSDLLRVESLCVGVAGIPILRDISFRLGKGEMLGIVGESGSGKSMIARALPRLLPHGVMQTGGRISLDGVDLTDLSQQSMRRFRGARIGMVFQEPMSSLNPSMRIGAQMDEGLRVHRKAPLAHRRKSILSMLDRVGIRDSKRVFHSFPHELSGGMRQRVMIASVMLLKPDLLIADEPTTALDAIIERDVLDLLTDLAREEGTAVILISHDLALIGAYTQRAIVVARGKIVEAGPTAGILGAPRAAYTRSLLAAVPRIPPNRFSPESFPLLEVEDLSAGYPAAGRLFRHATNKRVVQDVSFSIRRGERLALIGESGSGKSTVGRAIMGLLAPSSGQIRVDGTDAVPVGRAGWKPGRQLVFQDPAGSLDPRMRVGDLVAEALRTTSGVNRNERRDSVIAMLRRVGLGDDYLDRLPHQLSGGQRQRVAIARAVISHPKLLVADEAVSALDVSIRARILELLAELQEELGFACLFITHDIACVRQFADSIAVMREGKILIQGPKQAILAQTDDEYTKRLLEFQVLTEA